jgi:hypothetical protein
MVLAFFIDLDGIDLVMLLKATERRLNLIKTSAPGCLMPVKNLDTEGYYDRCDYQFYARSISCNTKKLAIAKNVNAFIMIIAGTGLYFGGVLFLNYFGLLLFTITFWAIAYLIGISFVFFLLSSYEKFALWWSCKGKKPSCPGIDI